MLRSAASQNSARTAFPPWQRAVFFSLVYFFCAWAGGFLSARTGNYVSFWLPAGLLVAVFLLNPTRDWPLLALAALPANLVFDFWHDEHPRILVILLFYFANVIQTVLGAGLVRRFVTARPALVSLHEFVGLISFAGIFSTMLGAVIGAATLTAFGMSHSFWQSWKVWWGSCAMAVLLLAPFILTWITRPTTKADFLNSTKKKVELAALILGLAAFLASLLAWDGGIMSNNRALAIPFLLWAGLRFGTRIGSAVSLLVGVVVAFFTTRYFVGLSPAQIATGSYVFDLQMFLAMVNLVTLIPAIVLGERDQTMARLRDSENRFRSLTEAAFEGIFISENGRMVDVSDQGLKMFGYARDEMIGKKIIELVAPASQAIVAEALRTGQETIYGHELRRKDGTVFYAEAQARIVRVGDRMLRMTALRDITEHKRAEQALRESEEKFSKAFRTSPDVMSITDYEKNCYLEVNDAHEKIFGLKREEVIGRSPGELGIFQNEPVHRKLHRDLKERGMVHGVEIEARTRDGRKLTLLHSAEMIELGGRLCVLRVSHDITERKQVEQALLKSEEKFSKAFRASPDGLAVSELETGRYVEVNEGYCRLYGYSREEMLAHTSIELGIWENPQDRSRLVEGLKTDGRVCNLEIRTRARTGEVKIVILSAEFIELGGRACLVSVLHDVTDRARAEQERAEAIDREQKARIEYTLQLIAAQEAERKRIAAELHDSIGQNLLLIKNLAQMALKTDGRELVYEQLSSISHLTTQCIAEARQISRDLHPYQLDHLGLRRALEAMLENAAQASSIEFTWKFEPVDELFAADTAMNLYRIVQESLNNILKHSRASRADVRLERDLHEVLLRIEDNGVGFTVENAGGQKGMGLKNITERVRMLDGRLNVESSPGKGTRIEVTIPFVEKPR